MGKTKEALRLENSQLRTAIESFRKVKQTQGRRIAALEAENERLRPERDAVIGYLAGLESYVNIGADKEGWANLPDSVKEEIDEIWLASQGE